MAAVNIISRLSSRFAGAQDTRTTPDYLTRDNSGHQRLNHPYISGYFQIIVGLPSILFTNISGSINNTVPASKWLHTTCESFTPHTQTTNKVDVQGFGQLSSSYITSVTTGREISFTFREYQALPILGIIKQWSSVIDPFTGVSSLNDNQFFPLNYKGWIVVVQTKPTRSQNNPLQLTDIEECYIYPNVFPTNLPLDALNSDVTANESANLPVNFSFDGSPLTSAEEGISEKCIQLLGMFKALGNDSTFDKTMKTGLETSQWTPVFSQSIPSTEVASYFA